MISPLSPWQTVHNSRPPYTAERLIVTNLSRIATGIGLSAAPSAMVNLYVALKAKPLAILVGPARSGKVAAVQTLAHVLSGGDTSRFHMFTGHAWWAGDSGDVGRFTEAQTRLNAITILDLITEAWRPENAHRVLIGCLARISPAEVAGLFSELAFQLRHGQVMQLPGTHLSTPVPYPPNLLLVGTLDAERCVSPEPYVFEVTTVIPWLGAYRALDQHYRSPCAPGESTFLRALVRHREIAYRRITRILEHDPNALQPLFSVENILRQHAVALPPQDRDVALVYLANAWDMNGTGLFDCYAAEQITLALDSVISQVLMPHVTHVATNAGLYHKLRSLISRTFPQSTYVLDSMSAREETAVVPS